MAYSKDKFDFQDVELANFIRALALPVRISIIRILLHEKDWVPGSRFSHLPMSTQVIERHLSALKTAGLICKMVKNGISFCKINTERFTYLSNYLTILTGHPPID